MKKIFVLACAASALGIASAAVAGNSVNPNSTGDQFSFTIQGTVPGYCILSSSGAFTVSNGSYSTSGNKGGIFQIQSLGTPGGVVEAVSMRGSFEITANESCNLSLVSANGALTNQSNTAANAINYNAVVFQDGSGTPVSVPGINTPFSSFNTKFDSEKLGNGTVNFDFEIAKGSNPVAAGSYQDVLTLVVSPTI